jgi:hypothetical protein
VKILHMAQLSADWFEEHLGRVTASGAGNILNFLRSGESGADRRNYLAQKVAEKLSGCAVTDGYVSPEMLWGIEHEGDARRAYSLEESVFVEQVGFVIADDERFGCSPDGFVGDKGIVGFKCPKTSTHIKWMLEGVIPLEHLPQARFELFVCRDRQWFDFVSFDPRLPKRYRMFQIRLMREDAMVPEMGAAADAFMDDMDAMIAKLEEIAPPVEEDTPEDLGDVGLTDADLDLLPK